jgi:hypothetical protein
MLKPSSPVHQLEVIDHDAFLRNCQLVKPDALINGVYELHEILAERWSAVIPQLCRNQREALTDCLQAIRREFLFGCLTCLRAHSTDGENYRRKAIEFCAFGIQMIRFPLSSKVWLEALKSKTKYRSYKNMFKVMTVLKDVADTGIELSMLYEELCKEVHASPYAIKTQTRIYVDEKGQRLNYLNYHDDYNEDERCALAQRFVTGIEADFFTILTFATAMRMQFPDLDMSRWNEKVQAFLELLESEKSRIKDVR